MLRSGMKIVAWIVLVVFVSGCSVKAYSVRKDREDQELAGNAGYVGGAVPMDAHDSSQYKKTRKTYVIEFQTRAAKKEAEEADRLLTEAEAIAERAREAMAAEQAGPVVVRQPAPQSVAPVVTEQKFIDYKVEKDDTLQKISMKFYNTTRKWPRIYDANKDVIKDPNRIKPGSTLRIPQE